MALRGQPDRRFSQKRLGRAPQGRVIVNLASTAGPVGSTQDPLYSMTKGGVTLFTKSATRRICPQGLPRPGQLDTPARSTPTWAIRLLVTGARNVGTNDIEVARRQVIGPAADRPDGTGVSVSEREV